MRPAPATLRPAGRANGTRRFGRIIVEGTPLFSAEHIQTIARFEPGERFRQPRGGRPAPRAGRHRARLVGEIRPVARPDSDIVDIAVALEPAPMRTIAGEAGYGTGEGFRVEASWQHRNLIPPEGAVTLRGVLGTREQLVGATLRRNNFREPRPGADRPRRRQPHRPRRL